MLRLEALVSIGRRPLSFSTEERRNPMAINRNLFGTLLWVTVLVLFNGCGGGATKPATEDGTVSTTVDSQEVHDDSAAPAEPAEDETPGDTSASESSAETPTEIPDDPSSPEVATEALAESEEIPAELSAAHILIMHVGSERVPPEITRTKEEALLLADEVAQKAQAPDADFAALAKEYSDGPSSAVGGNLGVFRPEQMIPEFSDATIKLEIGAVSGPVETDFGFHIILRQKIERISAKHILVMHQDSQRKPADVARSKEEALTRITECLQRAREGEKFEDLAREYSDGPSGPDGGDLGSFGRGQMVPEFEEAIFAAEVGDITEIVETPFGYHIIYRYE